MQRKPRMGLFVFVAALTIVSSIGLWLSANEIKAPTKPDIDSYARRQPPGNVPEPATPQPQAEEPAGPMPALFGEMRFPAIQDPYPGLPVERLHALRAHRDENCPLRLGHRVAFQRVELGSDGRGMQLRGDVLTDFPTARDTAETLALKIDITLYFYDVVVERNFKAEVQQPWLAPGDPGRPVFGQQVEVTINETWQGLGRARFVLPPMKPLAPGIYRLVARVDFGHQQKEIARGLRWCHDLYGREQTIELREDPYGNRYTATSYHPVVENPERHEHFYKRLMHEIGGVETESVIYMGSALNRHGVRLVTPHGSSPSQAPTHVIWTEHLDWLKVLSDAEEHLADIEKGVPYSAEEAKYRREQTRRIAREINALGGVIDSVQEGESLHLWKSLKARDRILESIADLHDRLRLQYWILLEAHLGHAGWNSVDRAGWRAFNAIRAQDLEVTVMPSPWRPRYSGDMRRRPRQIERFAARLVETDEIDSPLNPARFVERRDNMLFFDPQGWAGFRIDYLGASRAALEDALEDVETGDYAVQVFRLSFEALRHGFPMVLEFALATEFFIRNGLHAETPEQLRQGWSEEARAHPELYAGVDTGNCELDPARVLERFDAACRGIHDRLKLDHFAMRWRLAMED